MRDRFPVLVVGGLLFAVILGGFLLRGAARGDFADTLSTYRASENGARALYLLLQESGMAPGRRAMDLQLLDADSPATLLLLAVEVEGAYEADPDETRLATQRDEGLEDEEVPQEGLRALHSAELNADERAALLRRVEAGHSLVLVPWGSRENPLLDALEVKLSKADTSLPMRTLVPPLSTPYTLGTERVEAKVQAYLELPPGAVPLLVDAQLERPVAAVVPYGLGRVLVLGAPELAMNQALARADNAQFWLSALRALGGPGPFEFSEFHHGFSNERSVVDFARRYGLHFAVAQLLLGVGFWAVSLKRFGRPRPPPEALRVGATDALFAMSRLYREGRHHAFAAELITREVTQELALMAGLPAHTPAPAVAEGLAARGRKDLAQGLRALLRQAEGPTTDKELVRLATRAAGLRHRLLPTGSRAPAASPEES
ncbi:hypothetical protein SAMN05444354_101848 [Stigmatella aurantiaca]|uniref:DUF4350 domain-containing protein n=1 Tax=Stigmatella aurantiaca TaxID=41 RepID=A0A1H7HX11_STIAU|nr:DUF4350 domain-containing protein [Stigmatella aurantiaca]SEK54811.1 hypothetical protein SAMN05444354_101848 [Stigmatella aurantiaca]